jgi:hypothetical protein
MVCQSFLGVRLPGQTTSGWWVLPVHHVVGGLSLGTIHAFRSTMWQAGHLQNKHVQLWRI